MDGISAVIQEASDSSFLLCHARVQETSVISPQETGSAPSPTMLTP